MFWSFLIVSAICIALLKLGAVSVQVAILALSFKAALAVIAVLVGLLLWKRRKRN